MKTLFVIIASTFMLSAIGVPAFDAGAFLERISKISPSSPHSEMKAIAKIAEENGKAVTEAIVNRLSDKSIKDDDKVAYLWVLGLAKQESSVPMLLDIVKTSNPTSTLYHTSVRALTEIGGDEVGAVLLESYRQNKAKMSDEQRFSTMQALAMLKCASAVKDAEEFLKVDPERDYWQVYFIFGFFDDLAVPMLCEKLNDADGTVRTNALGAIRFLMPNSEALSKALLKRLESEKSPDIRYQLVETLEWNMLAIDEEKLNDVFSKLLEREAKDSAAARFMRETVESKGDMAKMREMFKPNAERFNAAYQKIINGGMHFSGNREAAQDILRCASSSDIPKLKELRRRVLYRQSDECFYDYQALTRIIQMVRVVGAGEKTQK